MLEVETLYCQIRKEWVAALPEEYVRQRLIHSMLHELHFPIELIAVEKAIRHLPHLAGVDPRQIPNRRIDIVCYCPGGAGTSLEPLLVVECKATPLTWRVINQVLGYNVTIRSRYVAIANATEVRLGRFNSLKNEWVFSDQLPDYSFLEF